MDQWEQERHVSNKFVSTKDEVIETLVRLEYIVTSVLGGITCPWRVDDNRSNDIP